MVVYMLVKEVMTKPVISIDRNKTIFDASNLYKDFKVGCLIVTDNGKCIGMLTERDIIERTICEHKNPGETIVGEVMSSEIKKIHSLDTIENAIKMMIDNNIKKLPVIENEEIVGIITVTDISRARPDLSKRFIESWVKPKWRD